MRYLDYKMMRTALAALAIIVALAACHDGSGAADSSDEGGGDDAAVTEAGFSEAQIAAEDGLILEFTEPMDTASVESHLLAYSGDVDVLASLSEGKADDAAERIEGISVIWSDDDTVARVKFPLPHCQSATAYLNPDGVLTREGAALGGDVRRAVVTRGPNYVDFDGECKGDIAFPYINERFSEYDFFLLTYSQVKSLFLGEDVDPIEDLVDRPGVYQYDTESPGITVDLGFVDGGQTGVPSFGLGAGALLFSGYTDEAEEMVPKTSIGSEFGKDLKQFSSLGDLDGDGAWDMAMTIEPQDGVRDVYVIMGSADILDKGLEPLISDFDEQHLQYVYNDMSKPFCGGEREARHAVGDFDGDGRNDMTICHTSAAAGEDSINVIMGSDEFVLSKFGDMTISNSFDDSGFTLQRVAAADVNGDLHSDLVVTYVESLQRQLKDNVGAGALIIPGSAAFGENIVASEAAVVDIAMPDSRAVLAEALGDINADGYHDFALTAVDVSIDMGLYSTYIFLGRSDAEWQARDWSYADADHSFEGSYDEESEALESYLFARKAGDLNNDGVDDIVVAVHRMDSLEDREDMYYYLGRASGGLRKLVRIQTYYEYLD